MRKNEPIFSYCMCFLAYYHCIFLFKRAPSKKPFQILGEHQKWILHFPSSFKIFGAAASVGSKNIMETSIKHLILLCIGVAWKKWHFTRQSFKVYTLHLICFELFSKNRSSFRMMELMIADFNSTSLRRSKWRNRQKALLLDNGYYLREMEEKKSILLVSFGSE